MEEDEESYPLPWDHLGRIETLERRGITGLRARWEQYIVVMAVSRRVGERREKRIEREILNAQHKLLFGHHIP